MIFSLQISETIIANQDFGICYTFFANNHNIYLKENDFIGINVSKDKVIDFLVSYDVNDTNLFDENTFNFYYLINNPNIIPFNGKQEVFKSDQIGFYSELTFDKTSVKYLSAPYMQLCNEQGKINFSDFSKNFFGVN